MKTYFVDTNVFLRFYLQDIPGQFKIAQNHFTQARKGKEKLILLPQIVMEVNFALQKYYKLDKPKALECLFGMVNNPDIIVYDREILNQTLTLYEKINIDLVDAFLYANSIMVQAEVLSFDKDFKKIVRNI